MQKLKGVNRIMGQTGLDSEEQYRKGPRQKGRNGPGEGPGLIKGRQKRKQKLKHPPTGDSFHLMQ